MASKKLGTLIDRLYETRDTRLELQRHLDKLKEKEAAAEQRVMAELQKANLQKAAGAKASVSIVVKTVGQVAPQDWAVVHAFVEQYNAWDLLQKRLNNAAVRERLEQGQEIPGVKSVQILDLSVRGL